MGIVEGKVENNNSVEAKVQIRGHHANGTKIPFSEIYRNLGWSFNANLPDLKS